MNRQHLEKLTVVSTVYLFFFENWSVSLTILQQECDINIHINNSGICFLEVTK